MRAFTGKGVMKADEKPRFSTLDGKPLYHFMGTSTFSGALGGWASHCCCLEREVGAACKWRVAEDRCCLEMACGRGPLLPGCPTPHAARSAMGCVPDQ